MAKATTLEFVVAGSRAPAVSGPSPRGVRTVRQGAKELSLRLYQDRPLLFGRGSQCNVVLPSDLVSREHARLWMREDGHWVIRDLGSRNGSTLIRGGGAGNALTSRDTPLVAGDVVWLAGQENRLELLAGAPASSETNLSAQSTASRGLADAIRICAGHRLAVFIIGPSGSGKTHVARCIHETACMPGQFILVNCGRLPTDPIQLQSELLGHTRGAFTGAVSSRVGKFYAADGGTLFLDEVEYLPAAAQDFLIDLLDGSGSFAPLGAPPTPRFDPPNARIIAASKRPLAQSGLRPDLCHRLAAADVIALPSLEERRGDIPGLVEEFLRQYERQQSLRLRIEPDAVALLQREPWPGQVRELETVVKVTAAREYAQCSEGLCGDGTVVITVDALRRHLANRKLGLGAPVCEQQTTPGIRKRPEDLAAADVIAALEKYRGVKAHAARELGISVNTLKGKIRLFGLAG